MGPELRRMDARRAGRVAGGRSDRPAEHEVQGRRGRLHPAQRGRDVLGDGPWLPGVRLPGHAGGGGRRSVASDPVAARRGWRRRRITIARLEGVPGGRRAGRRRDHERTGGGGGAGRRVRHHLLVGYDRISEGRGDDARAIVAHVRHVGLDRRTRIRGSVPHREPVLPHVRLQGRDLGLSEGGRDRGARAGVRRRRRDAAHRGGAHQRAAGAADPLPDAVGLARSRKARPVLATPGGHRRCRRPRRAGAGHGRGARLRHRAHRLRAHRVVRDGHHVPTQRPARGHRRHVGARHPRARGPNRFRRGRGGAGGARRDRRPRLHRDDGVLGQRRGDRRGNRRRRLAPHRRHRGDGPRRQRDDHGSGEGHVRRGRVQRVPGRDRGDFAGARGGGAGGGGRGARRADGRGGLRLRRPGRRSQVRRHRGGGRPNWGGPSSVGRGAPWRTTKCPAASCWSTSCR